MELANASLVLGQKEFPFSGLDEFFRLVAEKVRDGYVVVKDDGTRHYLFIIEGKPYCGAFYGAERGPERKGCTRIRDFFAWYRERGSADIDVFSSDKKTLLCMLVRLNYTPTQSFSTDVVNLEDVLKRIKKQGRDSVMAIGSDGRWGFAIFMKGEAVFASLPAKEESDATPLDRILLYTYNAPPQKPLSVEIYTETKVTPAEDTLPFPEKGIATHYAGAPHGAYVELIEGGVVKGTYPVTEKLTIGRETTNQVHLSEAGVSREHALIRKDVLGNYVIEDLKSANGTFFRGIRINVKELFDRDEINVRRYTLRFHGPRKREEAKKPIAPFGAMEIPEESPPEPEPAPGPALIMDDGTAYPLGGITTIGRDEECDIKLAGILVAKRHATVVRGKGVYQIVRKGLTALKVNGEKVDECILKHGDVIEIGGRTLKFRAA